MADAHQEEEIGIPEWVVTFGDMMSLLLTFFVLLFSMSEIKQESSEAMLESLRRQFGHDRTMMSLLPGRTSSMTAASARPFSLGRARRTNTMNGGDKVKAPVGDNPRVSSIRPADDTSQGGAVYFLEGRNELADGELAKLEGIAQAIRGKPQMIEVRGHTSNLPLPNDSSYHDHWELAFARCVTTMEHLLQLEIDRQRVRFGVAASHEPAYKAANPDRRKENCRVEI